MQMHNVHLHNTNFQSQHHQQGNGQQRFQMGNYNGMNARWQATPNQTKNNFQNFQHQFGQPYTANGGGNNGGGQHYGPKTRKKLFIPPPPVPNSAKPLPSLPQSKTAAASATGIKNPAIKNQTIKQSNKSHGRTKTYGFNPSNSKNKPTPSHKKSQFKHYQNTKNSSNNSPLTLANRTFKPRHGGVIIPPPPPSPNKSKNYNAHGGLANNKQKFGANDTGKTLIKTNNNNPRLKKFSRKQNNNKALPALPGKTKPTPSLIKKKLLPKNPPTGRPIIKQEHTGKMPGKTTPKKISNNQLNTGYGGVPNKGLPNLNKKPHIQPTPNNVKKQIDYGQILAMNGWNPNASAKANGGQGGNKPSSQVNYSTPIKKNLDKLATLKHSPPKPSFRTMDNVPKFIRDSVTTKSNRFYADVPKQVKQKAFANGELAIEASGHTRIVRADVVEKLTVLRDLFELVEAHNEGKDRSPLSFSHKAVNFTNQLKDLNDLNNQLARYEKLASNVLAERDKAWAGN